MKYFWTALFLLIILLLADVETSLAFLLVGLTCFIMLIISAANKAGGKKSETESRYSIPTSATNQSKSQQKIDPAEIRKYISVTIGSNENDDSIIDVTGRSVKLDYDIKNSSSEKHHSSSVPFWYHTYIYSTRELQYANDKVKRFYREFKEAFLAGVYYDIEDNSNYAFTLMFDFLEQYEENKDYEFTVSNLENLIEHYPRTESYAIDNTIKIAKELGYDKLLGSKYGLDYLINKYPDSHLWTFSDKYGKKISLSPFEQELFDFIAGKYGSFYFQFDFMVFKSISFFRKVIERLDYHYYDQGITLHDEIYRISKTFSLGGHIPGKGYANNIPTDTKVKEVYNCLFRLCKNHLVREIGFGWEIDIYESLKSISDKSELVHTFIPIARKIVKEEAPLFKDFSDEEEIQINASYTTRWRNFYSDIENSYDGDVDSYLEKVKRLAYLNKDNEGLRHLLFDITKFLVGKDNTKALKIYLEYVKVYARHNSDSEKPLPKYICKKLFKKEEEQDEFEEIVRLYKEDGDKVKAENEIDQLFLPKRKKLNLDSEEISKIVVQHSETVQLLNEVLSEGLSEEDKSLVSPQPELTTNAISPKIDTPVKSMGIELDPAHIELLDIFARNNHSLAKTEVEEYAKSRGLMSNLLIEKINDICYDSIDDVLIEDEDDTWSVTEEYLKKIVA